MPDYRSYRLSAAEWLPVVLGGAGLLLGFGWLFYRSPFAGLLGLPLLFFLGKQEAKRRQEIRRQKLIRQFRDGMRALVSALGAGYAIENAFAQAERELVRIYGEKELLPQEFALLRRRLAVSWTVEEALQDLAERSGLEEIRELAQVFAVAKRSGGPLPQILQQTLFTMEEKVRVKEEIRTMIAAKRLEFMLMCLMPPLMLAYVGLTGGDFLTPLYEGGRGRICMTVFLMVYFLAVWLGRRILRLEV